MRNSIHKKMPVAVVLGGTNPHIELLKKLQKRGYYTILVDYLENPPASKYADEHIKESTLDKSAVSDIVRKTNAAMVITTNIDQANVTACYAAEQNGLIPPYSYETALNVTDKSRMKKIMKENNIATSDYVVVESEIEATNAISYPAVIKPADSKGSRGVYRLCCDEDLQKFFPYTKKESRNNKVIIEKYIEGPEVSFYYYVQDNEAYFIDAYQRFNFESKNMDVIQSTGVVFPAWISKEAYSTMHEITQEIIKAFGLNNTPLFVQAKIKDDMPYVLEFAPRIGGGLSYRVIERDCQFDLIDAAISSFEGNHVNINPKSHDYFAGVLNIYAPGIIIGEIKGANDVISKGMATEFYQYHFKGAEIDSSMSSGSRAGAFLIHATSIDEIREKVFYINDNVEVFDINGKKSMRHDIYEVWKKKPTSIQ